MAIIPESLNALLAKVSGDGKVMWIRAYGGPSYDLFRSVLRCADGGLLAVGQSESFLPEDNFMADCYLVRTDALGRKLWSRTLGTEVEEIAYGAVETASGDFLIGAGGFEEAFLFRVNASGSGVSVLPETAQGKDLSKYGTHGIVRGIVQTSSPYSVTCALLESLVHRTVAR